jgi:hypothetical protein
VGLVSIPISFLALIQSNSASKPHVLVTAVEARSHVACNYFTSEFNTVAVVPFRLSNVGGRAVTLVGLSASSSIPPVVARSDSVENDRIWNVLTLLDTLGRVPRGIDAPQWIIDSLIQRGEPLALEDGGLLGQHPPALNLPIQPGESQLVSIGLTSLHSDSTKRITEFLVTLEANFNDGEKAQLRSTVAPPSVGRGGTCRSQLPR